MRGFYPTSVVFTPGIGGTGTIVLSSIPNFDIRDLGMIVNQTRNQIIYATGVNGKGFSSLAGVNNSTLTLQYDTSTHDASDIIQVMYDSDQNALLKDANGNKILLGRTSSLSSISVSLAADISALPVSNGDITIFESFNTLDVANSWSIPRLASGDILTIEGNTIGSNYLVLSLDPLGTGTSTVIETKYTWPYTSRILLGASRNIAAIGKEFAFEYVSDSNLDTISGVPISRMWQNGTTALMISTDNPHNFRVGQSFSVVDTMSGDINYCSLVVAATPSPFLLSATGGPSGTTLPTNLTYTALSTGGYIILRPRMGGATNGLSMLWENSTNTNASFYNRSDAGSMGDTLPGCANANFVNNHSSTIGTNASVVPFTLPNVYSFLPTNQYELIAQPDYIEWFDRTLDSTTLASVRLRRDQLVPNPTKQYKFRIRGVNNLALTKPDVRVLSAIKTASNTLILSCDGPHNCTALMDTIHYYGAQDQVNFPNITTSVLVCATPLPNVLTVVTGAVGTFASYGGYISKRKSSNAMSVYGAVTQPITGISRTNNVLTLSAGTGNWSGPVIGEFVNIFGCISANTVTSYGEPVNVDGPYRVQNIQGSILWVEPITAYNQAGNVYTASPTGADFGLLSCGGAIVRRNEIRVNYIRGYKFNRNVVEAYGGVTRNDSAASIPVYMTGQANTPSVNISQVGAQTVITGGTNGSLAVGGNQAPGAIGNQSTLNPVVAGIEDVGGNIRKLTGDPSGGLIGPGEFITTFSIAAGSFTPTEGTHAKSFFVPPKDSQIILGTRAVGVGVGTQVEGSYDNRIFSCIPMTRIDNMAVSNQYTNVSAWVPAVNAVYKGNTYGYPIIRIHNVSWTSGAPLSGVLRVIPNYEIPGQTIVPFTLSGIGAGGTISEAVGNANGNLMLGTVKTIPITVQGSSKIQLIIDNAVGIFQLNLEGSADNATTYQSISVTPLSGGTSLLPYLSVNSTLASPFMGIYEANTSNLTHARIRMTNWALGSASGALKITNIPSNAGLGNSDKASYTASVFNEAYTTSNGLVSAIALESGPFKTTRIRRLVVQPGLATSTTVATLCVFRYTTAAVTGGAITTASMQKETTDPAYTGLAKKNITNVNAAIQSLTQFVFQIPVPASTLSPAAPLVFDFTNGGTEKGIGIPIGTTNGVLFGYSGSGTGATGFGMQVDFTEE
jgi:hypothetical protein